MGQPPRRLQLKGAYWGDVIGILVVGDLITLGMPTCVIVAFGMLGIPEVGLGLAAIASVVGVLTARRCRVVVDDSGVVVVNRFRSIRFDDGARLRFRSYRFSSRSMSVLHIGDANRTVPVVAAFSIGWPKEQEALHVLQRLLRTTNEMP